MSPVPPRSRRGSFSRWAPVIAYMAFIFGLSSVSNPPDVAVSDKGLHWLLYAGLAWLTVRALADDEAAIGVRVAMSGAAIAALYGVSDEFHQLFVTGRSFDYRDMLANGVGALCGAWGAVQWVRMKHGL